jgi:hypothetical protein
MYGRGTFIETWHYSDWGSSWFFSVTSSFSQNFFKNFRKLLIFFLEILYLHMDWSQFSMVTDYWFWETYWKPEGRFKTCECALQRTREKNSRIPRRNALPGRVPFKAVTSALAIARTEQDISAVTAVGSILTVYRQRVVSSRNKTKTSFPWCLLMTRPQPSQATQCLRIT